MQQNQQHLQQSLTKQQLSPSSESNTCSDLDIFQILTSVFVSLARSQQIVQCIRQVLVQDQTFTPMSLFKYISKNNTLINTRNLLDFLQENNLVGNEKQMQYLLSRVFAKYGIVNLINIQYTHFLNFLYPNNTGVLRQIGVNKVKNYPQLDKTLKNSRPCDTAITGFLSLLEQEIQTQKKIEAQLSDPRFPNRDKLRKIIKMIKKASQKICTTITQKSDNHISMLQMRNFLKAFMDVPQHLFLYLSRRLGMNKAGLIPIQNIEQALKKPKKKTYINNLFTQKSTKFIQQEQNMGGFDNYDDRKHQKEQLYKQQLYKQLAQTLKISNKYTTSTPRNKIIYPGEKSYKNSSKQQKVVYYGNRSRSKSKNKTPQIKNAISFGNQQNKSPIQNFMIAHDNGKEKRNIGNFCIQNETQSPINNSSENNSYIAKVKNQQKHYQDKHDQNWQQTVRINEVFKSYVKVFLNGHKEIQRCKGKLVVLKVDFLALFKSLDSGRGAIDSEDVRKFYVRLSGIPTDYDFQLIVNRYAQPDERWLSYSQFTDIFRSNASSTPQKSLESLRNTATMRSPSQIQEINQLLKPETIRALAQILYLTLDLEHCLRQIINQLTRQELQWIFYRINVDSQSKEFINYQQLKKYITQQLQISVNMMDLMALLKRLDKSKNGVVLKEQFLLI